MAIVDSAFHEWIAEFKAINPGFAETRQIIDTAQYAFAAGRKAQRETDAARQPVGEPFGYCADFDPGAHEFSHTFYYLAPGGKVPEGCTPFFAAPPAQAVDLATDHCGMRIDYHGLLRQVQRGLRLDPALAEMVRQLHGHLTELGKRWYAGDRKVVDELLQLYGIEEGARRALIDSQAVGNG